MSKHILVSWSGGYNSTFMLWKLSEGTPIDWIIDTIHVTTENDHNRTIAEKYAQNKIYKLLFKSYPNKLRVRHTVNMSIDKITTKDVEFSKSQTTLLNMCKLVTPKYGTDYDYIYFGNIQSEIESISSNLFSTLGTLASKIKFPLLRSLNKLFILNEYGASSFRKTLFKHCRTCELPKITKNDEAKRCGKCPACVERKVILNLMDE